MGIQPSPGRNWNQDRALMHRHCRGATGTIGPETLDLHTERKRLPESPRAEARDERARGLDHL
jgi:hypothetical protein